jgi:hypothetical protein
MNEICDNCVRIREMRELLHPLLQKLLLVLCPYHHRIGHVLAHFVTSTYYAEKVMGGAVIMVVRICHSHNCVHVKSSWNRIQNTVDVISLT